MPRASNLWLPGTTMLLACGGIGPRPPSETVPPNGAVPRPANEVDERGTTAAAATGTTVGVLIKIDSPDQLFVVDRPFLFFIRHNPTGAILFQGRVVDPSR